MRLVAITSGGQTGAERGGLNAAIASGIEHGGWCPEGRKGEDGPIPAFYRLREDTTSDFVSRTRLNVRAADATVIFYQNVMGKDSRMTRRIAEQLGRPYIVVDIENTAAPLMMAPEVERFIFENDPMVVNIAGSRESRSPGIERAVEVCLSFILGVLLNFEPLEGSRTQTGKLEV